MAWSIWILELVYKTCLVIGLTIVIDLQSFMIFDIDGKINNTFQLVYLSVYLTPFAFNGRLI